MGIESDQLVFDYLSRVGDLAQQRQLPSATRMRLVSDLRGRIDHSRSRPATPDSPTAVRRILARLGSPEEIVDAVAPGPHIPEQPSGEAAPASGGAGAAGRGGSHRKGTFRRAAPGPDLSKQPGVPAQRPPGAGGLDDLGSGEEPPGAGRPVDEAGAGADWWRVDSGPFGTGDRVAGFVGGIEIPELLRRPGAFEDEDGFGRRPAPAEGAAGTDAPAGDGAVVEGAAVVVGGDPRARRRLRVPRPPSFSNPFLLLAAASLVVGAVLGNWILLAVGWLFAWGSRRLTPAESKLAVAGIPALAVVTTGVWLWGRRTERWGAPLAEDQMSAAISEAWPWVIRGAAIASAVFVVWRSQKVK
ncbi:HAAS signaling domain-containing protein [Streptomyces sp. NPDC007088]|uniref:HAAS signaling domain-containing protein n=1 Tax=Streptomyces sp. NPDC007088 TaxID=3364773 RepID=UPI0036A48471